MPSFDRTHEAMNPCGIIQHFNLIRIDFRAFSRLIRPLFPDFDEMQATR
jgi:hypothetical protein